MEKLQARNRCPIRLVGVGRQRHRGVRQVDRSRFGAHVEKLTKIGCGDPSEGASDLSECTRLGGRVGEDEAAEFEERAERCNERLVGSRRITQVPVVDQWNFRVARGPGAWGWTRNVGIGWAFDTNELQDR